MTKKQKTQISDYIQTRLYGYQIDIMAIGSLCRQVEALAEAGTELSIAVDQAFQALMDTGKLVKV